MSATPPPDNNDRTVMPFRSTNSSGGTTTPATHSNMLPAGTKLLGEFEIIAPVGEGGFGIVYLAYDHALRRNVAIKEYMPSALAARKDAMTVAVKSERHLETFTAGLKSFVNEARLLAQFDHPSLLKVYRFWEANGTAYMVMPYYEGVSLKDMLKNLGHPPDETWLKNMLVPLLDALDQLHREKCFHRDISPDNILILNDGRLLLLDFGAARRVIGDMTQSLTVVLRPGYAPIEQYDEMPDMKQGPWTDVYALASVLYFAIIGKAPVSSVARLMSDPLQPLHIAAAGRYSDQFLRGIDNALRVLPQDRLQNISELRGALGMATSSTQTTVHDKPADAPPAPKRLVRPYAIGAAALVAVAVATSFLFSGPKEVEPTPLTTAPQPLPAIPTPMPVSAPTVPQPVAKKPFSPNDMLDQIFDNRSRSHMVAAFPEKSTVRIGRDRLRFSVNSSKAGYVYVLTLGTDRSDFGLLFPNTIDRNNRIAPGKTLNLPGESWPVKALGPAGTNRFVVIVSDEPRDFSVLRPEASDIFQKFPLDVGTRLYRDYAGVTPLYAGKAVCASKGFCSSSYGAASFVIEEVSGG